MKKFIILLFSALLILSLVGVMALVFSASLFKTLPELQTAEQPFQVVGGDSAAPTIEYYWPIKFLDGVILVILSLVALGTVVISYFSARVGKRTIPPRPSPDLSDYFDPAKAAYFGKGYADNSDFAALLFYWAEQGRVQLQGLPQNIINHGFIHKVKPLPEHASRYEQILFDAIFKEDDKQSFRSLPSILEGCSTQLEEALIEENYFRLYTPHGRVMQGAAIAFSTLPVLFLQFFRGGSIFSVILPTLSLYLCGVLTMFLLERKQASYTPFKKCAFSMLSCVFLLASFCASMFLRTDILHNQFVDIIAYVCGIAALPFAVFSALPAPTGAQKRAELRAWQTFITTKYPNALPASDQAAYFYQAMPCACALQIDSLFFKRVPQANLPLPRWYIPIWYEIKEGESPPTQLTTAQAYAYYSEVLCYLDKMRKGNIGEAADAAGLSPFGPVGPINLRR